MRRHLVVFILLVGCAVVGWFFLRVSMITRAQSDVMNRFHDVVSFYGSMRTEYVEPLLNIQDLTEREREDLLRVSSHLQELNRMNRSDDQYRSLLAVQREIMHVFSSADFTENLTDNRTLVEWAREATNQGKASFLLYRYNTALALYKDRSISIVGRLMHPWEHWGHTEFLSIDGSTQSGTSVTF